MVSNLRKNFLCIVWDQRPTYGDGMFLDRCGICVSSSLQIFRHKAPKAALVKIVNGLWRVGAINFYINFFVLVKVDSSADTTFK